MKRIIICLLTIFIVFSYFAVPSSAFWPFKSKAAKINAEELKVLAYTQDTLDSRSAKAGDKLCFITLEDVLINEKVILPSGSLLNGNIHKVKKIGRLSNHAKVDIKISLIKLKNGKTLEIDENGWIISFKNPNIKTMKKKIWEKAPILAAGYATTIPLGAFTELGTGVIYLIGSAASVTAGGVSGAMYPNPGQTRYQSCLNRAYNSTAMGYANTVFGKGKNVIMKSGVSVMLVISKDALNLLMEEAQSKITKAKK